MNKYEFSKNIFYTENKKYMLMEIMYNHHVLNISLEALDNFINSLAHQIDWLAKDTNGNYNVIFQGKFHEVGVEWGDHRYNDYTTYDSQFHANEIDRINDSIINTQSDISDIIDKCEGNTSMLRINSRNYHKIQQDFADLKAKNLQLISKYEAITDKFVRE